MLIWQVVLVVSPAYSALCRVPEKGMDVISRSFSCEHSPHPRHQDKYWACVWAQEWLMDLNWETWIWTFYNQLSYITPNFKGALEGSSCLWNEDCCSVWGLLKLLPKSSKEKWSRTKALWNQSVVHNRRLDCKRDWKEIARGVRKPDNAAHRNHKNESLFNMDKVVHWVRCCQGLVHDVK